MLPGLLLAVGRVRAVGPRTMQCLSFGAGGVVGLEGVEMRLVCSDCVSFLSFSIFSVKWMLDWIDVSG